MHFESVLDDDVEASLQTHIRSILHDYILEHLTIEQAQYTTEIVSEFVSHSLFPIPDHEPSAVALPVDPLELLKATLKLDSLKPYEEAFIVDGEAISYIKSHLFATKCKSKSQRVWDEVLNVEDDYKCLEVFSPILCRESRIKTPHIATRDRRSPVPRFGSLAKFYQTQNFTEVETVDIEHGVSQDVDTCLDIKFTLDSSTLSTIVAMRRDNPFLNKAATEKKYLRGNAREFLTQSSPTKNLLHLKPLSPPLFARRKRQRKDKVSLPGVPETMAEAVAPFQLVEVENMDLDVPKESMMLVDGWTTLVSSSPTPSTPSLSSGTSEVDELEDMWLPTSEADPSTSVLAADAKIDIYQMPRQKRMKNKQVNSDLHEKSLSSFLSNFTPEIRVISRSEHDPSAWSQSLGPPKSPITKSSMIGQLGSECNNQFTPSITSGNEPESEGDVKADIGRILLNVKDQRFQDVIMQEKLDEGDAVFMDVPYLPSAHELVKSRTRPMDLKSLVVDGPSCDSAQSRVCRLEAVSGVKPLNLELTWRPFNYGSNKPTHEEVLETQAPFSIEEIDGLKTEDKTALNELLTRLDSDAHTRATGDIVSRFVHEEPEYVARKAPSREVGLLLNRAERLRQQGENKSAICVSGKDTSELSQQEIIEAEALAILGTGSFESPHPYSMTDWPSVELPTASLDVNARTGFRQLMYPNDTYLEDSLSTLDSPGAQSISHGIPDDFMGFSSHIPSDNDLAIYDGLDVDHINDAIESPLVDPYFNKLYSDLNNHDDFRMDMPLEVMTDMLAVRPIVPSIEEQRVEQQHVSYPYHQISQPTNESSGPTNLLANAAARGTTPSVELLSDRSSVKTSLFFALRRGKAAPLDFAPSPPSASRGNEGPGQALNSNIFEPMTREPPPTEILDDPSYLWPPPSWAPPPNPCVCMVSLETFQKRALMKSLESDSCKLLPVGRSTLATADVIASPNTAILFFPLSALPSKCDYLSSRVCKASWHFDQLVVIFEAFPSNQCYKLPIGERVVPFAYGPPVLKAIKRFRRDISLREGLGEWNQNCGIRLAFANNVHDVAVLSRFIADNCTAGTANPDYMLTEEELEGEGELGSMIGMNEFTANMILRHCSLNDFLEMSGDDRQAAFGPLIGSSRMAQCNALLGTRLAQMECLQFSSDSGPNDAYAIRSSCQHVAS